MKGWKVIRDFSDEPASCQAASSSKVLPKISSMDHDQVVKAPLRITLCVTNAYQQLSHFHTGPGHMHLPCVGSKVSNIFLKIELEWSFCEFFSVFFSHFFAEGSFRFVKEETHPGSRFCLFSAYI